MSTVSSAQIRRGWLLAIDASTERASIALFDGVETSELSWPAGRRQTTSLLAEIEHLSGLAECNIRADLGCVAVATGPGMFNGLRVAMSIAKGFALAMGADLIGVPTLEIAAWPFAGDTVAVAAAGRSRLLWQRFYDGAPRTEAINGTFPQLLAELDALAEPLTVVGELSESQWAALAERQHVISAPPPAHFRRAGSLAAIGWRRWVDGETSDPSTLEPIYVHAATATAV